MFKKTNTNHEWIHLNKKLNKMNYNYKMHKNNYILRLIQSKNIFIKVLIYLVYWKKIRNLKLSNENYQKEFAKSKKDSYFSQEKIVIYTAIFGEYDELIDPVLVPDNCDFIVFTDSKEMSSKSRIWNTIILDDSFFPSDVTTPKDKNRYIKIKPHIFLRKYDHSIYVDGNLEIITDLTALFNRMTNCNISVFNHDRENIFQELHAIKRQKKDTVSSVKESSLFLKKFFLNSDHGLAVCSVIIRKHTSDKIIELMDEWWKLYLKLPTKRDQLSFPLALINKGIDIKKITNLGFYSSQIYLNKHRHN